MTRKHSILLGIGIVVAILAVWGFTAGRKEREQEQERERPVAVPPRVVAGENGSEVVFDAQARKLADIGVAYLTQTSQRGEIDALASVLSPHDLIDLRNRYVAASAEANKAAATLAASRSEYERLKVLHGDDRNVSDRTLQAAEAAWRVNLAAEQAARSAVAAIGDSDRQTWGTALSYDVAHGTPRFRSLVSQSRVLLRIAAPAGTRMAAPPAKASVTGDDGGVRQAELVAASPLADPRIQGPAFLYLAPAAGLLPGSTLSARLPVGSQEAGVTIPASAVLSWQGKAWFYVETSPGHFMRQELSGPMPVRGGEFMPGLKAMRVVVRGAQTLLSEELRGQTQAGDQD